MRMGCAARRRDGQFMLIGSTQMTHKAMTIRQRVRRGMRRGNAMVLVAGVLVLLVVLAAAYLTRTQTTRYVAKAVQTSAGRDSSANVIAESLAMEISTALFPRPVNRFGRDPITGLNDPLSSNTPRLDQLINPIRYGIDQDYTDQTFAGPPDGLPDYPFNFAPYTVIPWTNWPDELPGGTINRVWPHGVAAQSGIETLTNGEPMGEGNPFGNPGFGDTRWLRDLEPMRKDSNGNGFMDSFWFWRHMTNLSRPNNGWRICADISNVYDNIVTDLRYPVEQRLVSVRPANIGSNTGDNYYNGDGTDSGDFYRFWQNWLLPRAGMWDYSQAYADPNRIPPNFLNLKDLNANGTFHEIGERPQDEFDRGSCEMGCGSGACGR